MKDSNSSTELLVKITQNTSLTTLIQRLDTPILSAIIEKVGLEDSAELIALSSAKQLNELMDMDVWRTPPGEKEEFDKDRFGLWLEVLMELGRGSYFERACHLDDDFLVFGLSQRILAVAIGTFDGERREPATSREVREKA